MPMNLPNTITVLRLVAVPVAVWAILNGFIQLAFWVFLAAGISDGVDGYLARRWNQRTELGAYLDAIADKALLVSIYITLAIGDVIPNWLAIIVVFRDVMIVGAVILSWLMEKPITIKPLMVSKLNTVAQILFAAATLSSKGFGVDWGHALDPAAFVTAGLTLVSAAAYLAAWMRHMAEPELPKPSSRKSSRE
jgi:cardiolipin synthase (CMP-forming)